MLRGLRNPRHDPGSANVIYCVYPSREEKIQRLQSHKSEDFLSCVHVGVVQGLPRSHGHVNSVLCEAMGTLHRAVAKGGLLVNVS